MAKYRKSVLNPNQLPLFTPDSDWEPPTEFPDLSQAEYIGVDTETTDPLLREQGPGFIRGDASVCGISLATELGHKMYLPFAHSEGNLDRDKVISYVRAQLSRPHQHKVGANSSYDLEALWSLGIEVKGTFHDIQIAEPLLDADREDGYSLEVLARQYLGKGKNERLLKEAEIAYGVEHKRGMAHLPSRFVGSYAEDDADDAVQIFLLQLEELKADEVYELYKLEARLLHVLFKMRLNGVKVDLDKAERLSKDIRKEEQQMMEGLQKEACRPFELTAASLEPVLRDRGIVLPRTIKDAPSLTNDWLTQQKDPFCKEIVKLRKTEKMRRDFIEGSILKFNVRGRLHTKWQQLRGYDDDEGQSVGVKPGRIASNKPNLTQIPARDPRWGPLIRSLFIPDEGGEWVKLDYSQQEPRILLHFAVKAKWEGRPLEGAREALAKYIENPDIDYHQLTRELIILKTGNDIGRRNAKTINLGAAYGMGKDKLARNLGLSIEVAESIISAYHLGVPYVRLLSKAVTARANERGFVTTILGRRQRFQYWEPRDFEKKWGCKPIKSHSEAIRLWGNEIARYNTHVAINPLVQGSAADQTKQAIVMLDDEGLTPQIQVYDELNRTCYSRSEIRRIQEIMENAIPEFYVPFKAEPDIGRSWGELIAYNWNGQEYVETPSA